MKKNRTLEKLCASLAREKQCWDEIVGRSSPNLSSGQMDWYANYFSELWLDVCLDRMADKSDGKIKIEGSRLIGWQTKDYIFKSSDRGHVYCYKLSDIGGTDNQVGVSEYDKIMTVEGLPTVFEMKLTKNWHGSRFKVFKKKKSPSSLALKHHFSEDIYKDKLRPLIQYYGRDIAYVMIIPKDVYNMRENALLNSGIEYLSFKANNGMVVPFYTDVVSFRAECLAKLFQLGIVQPQEMKSNGDTFPTADAELAEDSICGRIPDESCLDQALGGENEKIQYRLRPSSAIWMRS